jgi:AhpC/TSA family
MGLALAMTVACSSSGPPKTMPMAQTPAPTATSTSTSTNNDAGAVVAGGDTNPEGIAYPHPAAGYGRLHRMGSMPGSIMQNFKFLGFRNGAIAQQAQRISLADYYDPCSKRYKLIHLSVASVWCVPCNQETDAVVAAKAQLDSKGVVVLQALDDGPVQGTGATPGDLNRWIMSHSSNFTEVLDPGLMQLAGFFDAAAVPWNCDLDPRTMEIIYDTTGWAGDVNRELAPSWSALPTTPSSPPPVSCN